MLLGNTINAIVQQWRTHNARNQKKMNDYASLIKAVFCMFMLFYNKSKGLYLIAFYFLIKLWHMLFPCCFVAHCITSFVRKLIAWMLCFTAPIPQVSTLTFAQLYYVCCVGHAKLMLCALLGEHDCCCCHHLVREVVVVVCDLF